MATPVQIDLEDWLMSDAQYVDDLKAFGVAFHEQLRNAAQRVAEAHTRPLSVAYDALVREVRSYLQRDDITIADNRAASWRARVRLYREDKLDDPEADSDPDSPPDAAGAQVCAGLPNVAHYLAELASVYHGGPCAGLSSDALRHKLKALRPTLSRRGGDAVWRVPYEVTAKDKFGEGTHVEHWLARVDVERVKPARKGDDNG